jgi:hypothetical protein
MDNDLYVHNQNGNLMLSRVGKRTSKEFHVPHAIANQLYFGTVNAFAQPETKGLLQNRIFTKVLQNDYTSSPIMTTARSLADIYSEERGGVPTPKERKQIIRDVLSIERFKISTPEGAAGAPGRNLTRDLNEATSYPGEISQEEHSHINATQHQMGVGFGGQVPPTTTTGQLNNNFGSFQRQESRPPPEPSEGSTHSLHPPHPVNTFSLRQIFDAHTITEEISQRLHIHVSDAPSRRHIQNLFSSPVGVQPLGVEVMESDVGLSQQIQVSRFSNEQNVRNEINLGVQRTPVLPQQTFAAGATSNFGYMTLRSGRRLLGTPMDVSYTGQLASGPLQPLTQAHTKYLNDPNLKRRRQENAQEIFEQMTLKRGKNRRGESRRKRRLASEDG